MKNINKYKVPVMQERLAKSLAPSLESANVDELEYDFYLKLSDFEQLESAKYSEHQEQWVIKFSEGDLGVNIRTRKVICEGEIKYFLTSKIKLDKVDASWELEEECTRFHYEEIKSLAHNGMIKERFFFPINGTSLVWEVDVFTDSDGVKVPWVKVDLEVPSKLDTIPELPLDYSEAVFNQKGSRTPEEDELIQQLYTKHFIVELESNK